MKNIILVKDYKINLKNDYISLTDIAKSKNKDEPKDVVKNWLRNKNTIEFLGLWERIKNEVDLLNIALFGLTAKRWRENNSDKKGNIRDYANVNQLVILANLEPKDRLERLNRIAISQNIFVDIL